MANNFLVDTSKDQHRTAAISPGSEDSNSSYDDGPSETCRHDLFPSMEHRMYIINRAGKGEVSYLLLTEDTSAILSYRVRVEKWKPIEGVMNFGTVVLDKWIYVIGGFDKARAVCLNRVLRYDPCEGIWLECKEMQVGRAQFGLCVLGGKIFVGGGERTDGKITASCEMYDPDANEWTKCGMLLGPRSGTSCVGFGSDLLCAGGFHGVSAHNNLWMYERHQWQEMDDSYPHKLPYCLHKCAVTSYGNTFFFIGGVSSRDQEAHLSTPDDRRNHHKGHQASQSSRNNNINNNNNNSKTKPRHNSKDQPKDTKERNVKFRTERRMFSYSTSILAGEKTGSGPHLDLISPWNLKLPPMIHARHSAGAVTVGTKLHVVGGTSVETGEAVKVSEHFELTTGQWEEDFTLRKFDVSNVSCLVVGVPKVPFADRKNTYRLRWVMW